MSDQNAALLPGQTILDRYRLKKMLGRGGFGVVWLADDEDLRMEVALKFLSELIASNPDAVEDLKRETRFSLRLTHPHIVRIYGFFHDGNVAGLSMEHVQGGTLIHIRAARGRRCFDLPELSPWIVQLCDALDYAHQKVHIVHRDLKPANLMLDQHGELKVADFGISRSISDSRTRLTNDRDTSGTLAYMSPQQMLGESASPLDDVYSVGATLYDLLSGKPPFFTGDIVQQVLHVTPPPIGARRRDLDVADEAAPVPPDWEATIAACLDKDAEKRPKSAGEVCERLGLRASTGGSTRTSAGLAGGRDDAALLETRPIDLPSGAFAPPSSPVAAPSSPSGAVAAPPSGAPPSWRGASAARAPADDSATVIVPATEIAPGSGRAAPAIAGRIPDPFASGRRRSKLPILIGAGILGVAIIGGSIFALTQKGGDSTATSQAAVVVPSSATPVSASVVSKDTDADHGLAPPRDETTQTRAGSQLPAAAPPEPRAAGAPAAPAAANDAAVQTARLRRQISREMGRRDWMSARDDARALLVLAPGDPDARAALSAATQKLDQATAAAAHAQNPVLNAAPIESPKPAVEVPPPAAAPAAKPVESPPQQAPAPPPPQPPGRIRGDPPGDPELQGRARGPRREPLRGDLGIARRRLPPEARNVVFRSQVAVG